MAKRKRDGPEGTIERLTRGAEPEDIGRDGLDDTEAAGGGDVVDVSEGVLVERPLAIGVVQVRRDQTVNLCPTSERLAESGAWRARGGEDEDKRPGAQRRTSSGILSSAAPFSFMANALWGFGGEDSEPSDETGGVD